MHAIKEAAYFVDCSDLKIIILRIYFSNDKYMKCKIQLVNINNGIDYGTTNEKIYFDNITHWQRWVFSRLHDNMYYHAENKG